MNMRIVDRRYKERDSDLLQAIFDEMQYLKRALLTKNEHRIGRAEFAKLLNIEPSNSGCTN